MDRYGQHRGSFDDLVIKFLGHLSGAAAMFVAILLVAWGLALLVHYLHTSHPFSAPVYRAITILETWLVYVDMVVCGIVLASGVRSLLRDAMEDMQ